MRAAGSAGSGEWSSRAAFMSGRKSFDSRERTARGSEKPMFHSSFTPALRRSKLAEPVQAQPS